MTREGAIPTHSVPATQPQPARGSFDELRQAISARDSLAGQVKLLERQIRRHRIRLWAASKGMNAATFALIAGSIVAFIQAEIQMFVFDAEVPQIFAGAVISYLLVGIPGLLYFRDLPGECAGNRIVRRKDLLKRTEEERRVALEDLAQKSRLAQEAEQAWQNAKQDAKKAA